MAETKLVNFKIDDRDVQVPAGTLVIEATRRIGIEVPSFCYSPGLSLQAACRMCLVEVEKAPKLQTACTLVATEGMVVRTNTEQVRNARKFMLEFLLSNHPLDCRGGEKGGECELQDMVFRYGADTSRFVEEKIHRPEEKWSDLVYYDAPRCILCFRCVRVCDEGMDVKALGVGMRGAHSIIIPNREDHLECEECGMCIDICPVGALTSGAYRYKTRPWEMKHVGAVCTHCGDGCKTTLGVRRADTGMEIVRGDNRDKSGINGDFLCIKGRYAFDFATNPDRIAKPLIKRDGKFVPATWDEAFQLVASRFKEAAATGPGGSGVIGSNRTSNEENYLLQKFARTVLGTNNIDHHRTADFPAFASAVAGKANATASMRDVSAAPAILLIGSDPTEQHPLLAWQVRTNVRLHRAKLYVVNSSPIKLRRQATVFAQIAPGSEASLAEFLGGKDGAADAVISARLTREALNELREELKTEQELVVIFGSEVRGQAVKSLVDFGLAQGAKFLCLSDYANSRGAADMGLYPDMLPGYAPVSSASKFHESWAGAIPKDPGLNLLQMVEAAKAGTLKALYVVGSNPVARFNIDPFALSKTFVVVQDMFLTETAAVAA